VKLKALASRLLQFIPYTIPLSILLFMLWVVWLSIRQPPSIFRFRALDATEFFTIFTPVVIALVYCLMGTLVWTFSNTTRPGRLLFLFSQSVAFSLLSGRLSVYFGTTGDLIFGLCLCWLGPFTVQVHAGLVFDYSKRFFKGLFIVLYSLSALLTIVYLLQIYNIYQFWDGQFKQILYPWSGINFVIVLVLLQVGCNYGDFENRRKSAMLLFSNALAFTPFVLFSLLPDAFGDTPYIPYGISFLFLVTIPIAYSYTFLRYRLLKFERYIDRNVANLLVTVLVASIYAFLYLVFSRLLPHITSLPLMLEAFIAVLIIFAVQPLYTRMQSFVNNWLYGTWYDNQEALKQISQSLEEAKTDRTEIAHTLCQVLERSLPVDDARLLLSTGEIIGSGMPWTLGHLPENSLEVMVTAARRCSGQQMGSAKEIILCTDLPDKSKKLLFGEQPTLWLLLRGNFGPLGFLVLGPRRGGGFDPNSLEVIELLTRQAKTALENISLLEIIRSDSRQITRLHRRLIQAREAERKGLARELHDQSIQALYGINYHLSQLKSLPESANLDEIEKVRGEVSAVLEDLRQLCSDLRPPSLDSLGIVPAMRALLRKFRQETGLAVVFTSDGLEDLELPEEYAMTFFRVLQESLANIHKHAHAQQVVINFKLTEGQLELNVKDDGKGFVKPGSFDSLTETSHFGLVGMRERVELVAGVLNIDTAPGQGCTLSVTLPYPPPLTS
jgi:signal transduction histidine kinase